MRSSQCTIGPIFRRVYYEFIAEILFDKWKKEGLKNLIFSCWLHWLRVLTFHVPRTIFCLMLNVAWWLSIDTCRSCLSLLVWGSVLSNLTIFMPLFFQNLWGGRFNHKQIRNVMYANRVARHDGQLASRS